MVVKCHDEVNDDNNDTGFHERAQTGWGGVGYGTGLPGFRPEFVPIVGLSDILGEEVNFKRSTQVVSKFQFIHLQSASRVCKSRLGRHQMLQGPVRRSHYKPGLEGRSFNLMCLQPLFQHKHYPDHFTEIGRVFLGVLPSDIMNICSP